MVKVSLPSEFGAINLEVCALEAPKYAGGRATRRFRAFLGAGKVNGKAWGRLEYSFHTEDGYNQDDGKPRICYDDWRAYADGESYTRVVMTAKGHSRVRDAIEAAVQAFIASEEFGMFSGRAESEQRTRIKSRGADYQARLQKRIREIQDLVAMSDTTKNPEELEDKLNTLWRATL